MVSDYFYTDNFEQAIKKLGDAELKKRVMNKINDIVERPSIGKPLGYGRKGERTARIPPFRIVYTLVGGDVLFLDFDKRDEVYRN